MRRLARLTALLVPLGLVAATVLTGPARASASSPIAFGAYASGFPGSGSQVSQLETQLGSKLAVASSFRGWGDVFPDATQQVDSDSGHTLLVAWDLGATSATRFTTFTSHAHDAYLTQEAAAAKTFGKTLYIRPWAEMNGDWSAFQPTPDGSRPAGGTPAQFIAAWRYLVDFFRNHGATNVRWVFNPTTDTYAGTTPVTTIWPGSAWVDVLGLDGYNWGTGGVFTWRSFADIYATQYARLTALDPSLPVWVCETGSKEPAEADGSPIDPAHSKAVWYQQMMAWLAGTGTHIRTVVMFDVLKERDWRVASDPAALTYMRSVIAAGAGQMPPLAAKLVTARASVRTTALSSASARATAKVRSGRRVFTATAVASRQVRRAASVTASARAASPSAAVAAARASASAAATRAARLAAHRAAVQAARAVAYQRALHAARAKASAATR